MGVVPVDAAVGGEQRLRMGAGRQRGHQGHVRPQHGGADAGEAPAEGRQVRRGPPLPVRRAAGG
eukprot:2952933-Pleurochrysis_carterae.AAC.1